MVGNKVVQPELIFVNERLVLHLKDSLELLFTPLLISFHVPCHLCLSAEASFQIEEQCARTKKFTVRSRSYPMAHELNRVPDGYFPKNLEA